MVTAIGFANAFDKAGLFASGRLTDVASNSGGSWFLTQFAYNGDFFSNALSQDAEALHAWVRELMDGYNSFKSLGGQENVILNTIGKIPAVGAMLDEAITAGKWLLSPHLPDWQEVIDEMLAATPGLSSRGFYKETTANQSSRVGLRGPTLHFQVAEVTSSYHPRRVFGIPLGYSRAFLLDHDKNPLSFNQGGDDSDMPVVPLQYIVRGLEGQDSSLKEGLQHPESTLYRYSAGFFGVEANPLTSSSRGVLGSELRDLKPTPPLPKELSVLAVASASSAAAGLLSSPLMLNEVVGNTLGRIAWEGLKLMLPGPFNGAGICSRDACRYPSRTFIDGGYVDDMATSQTVAFMQKKFGTSRPIRLVLTDSEQISPRGSSEPENLKVLLQGGNVTRPGLLAMGPIFFNVPRQQIFDVAYDGLRWVDLSSEFDSTQTLKYAIASGATVDNPAYGVKAGTPVRLLMFAYRSQLLAIGNGLADEYASVSSAIAKSSVRAVTEAWLHGKK